MDSDVLQERLFRAILLPPGSVPRYAVKSDLEFYRSENLPKVAMFQDLASRFSPLCPTSNTFAVTTHGYACSVEELSAMTPYPEDFALSESERSELLSQKPFDHTSSTNADLVVFSSYYRDLSSWLSQAPPLLLRPFHSSTTSPRATTRLGGYGIALDIKNTEYKVLDDRSSVGERLSARELKEETETETQGFLFSTLLRRYPSLSSSLEAFRESLASEQATAESIAPLALKDLGLKAAAAREGPAAGAARGELRPPRGGGGGRAGAGDRENAKRGDEDARAFRGDGEYGSGERETCGFRVDDVERVRAAEAASRR